MVARLSWQRAFRRFRKERRGSTTIEFSLIALPFFLLTIGLAEISMIGFVQTSLDNAVSESARRIRTGETQTAGLSGADVKGQLCQTMSRYLAVDCDSNLYLDIRRFDSFVDASQLDSPIENGEFQDAGFDYAPGAPSDIVVVRIYYRWQIMTPMFEHVFQNVTNGERILVSTMMFRNEPY